jgi:hypothetical protein
MSLFVYACINSVLNTTKERGAWATRSVLMVIITVIVHDDFSS